MKNYALISPTWRKFRENCSTIKGQFDPVIAVFLRRHLLPSEEVVKYLGFAKSVSDSKGFRGINPKYLTTEKVSVILKRYRLKKTAITSFSRHTPLIMSNKS
ncbi:MAG: hypothetical protein JRC68_04295 [Deltaproteobacteria bacterium]|nr:hypothetical protein [Deltaproteobacteria bacterium]